ncbi:MAG: DUF3566 domain-containing protein [bacterium]|nr:DUF3566 domain-containing protein [bacterium]
MKFEIKSIGIWSLIKVSFFLNLVMGFLMGVLTVVFLIPMMALVSEMGGFPGMANQDIQLSFGAMLIIIPVVQSFTYAVFGTILVSLFAGLYNLIARLLGGIELSVADITIQLIPDPNPAESFSSPVVAPAPPPPSTPAPPPIEPSPPVPPPDPFGADNPENDRHDDR